MHINVESQPSKILTISENTGYLGRAVDLPAKCRAYLYDQPDRILSQQIKDDIYRMLVPLTTSSFGADMTKYWAARKKQNYFKRLRQFVLLCNNSDEIIGWSGYSIVPIDDAVVIYFDSTGVVPAFARLGLVSSLRETQIERILSKYHGDSRSVYMTSRTESPVVYRMYQKLLKGRPIWPSVGERTPSHIIDLGALLAEWLGQANLLEADDIILRNAYAMLDNLYGELPSTGSADLDLLFRQKLGPLDAFLLFGQLR